ncbi:HEPN domain-containing protein [Larkinella sp. GY13]|uniref:HEPN domain-containing protein n=1 Tax=Larkinella sp. GY13 TaxID=3453720 RepID=UPI003EEA209E
MKQTKEDIVKYRATKSAATLKEAEILITAESWNGAANRLYYAAFQIVTALMTQEGIRIKSHSGAKHMLDLHFVKTGRLSVELGKFYGDLFNARQDSDYEDFIYFTSEDILPLLDKTNQFILAIRALLI